MLEPDLPVTVDNNTKDTMTEVDIDTAAGELADICKHFFLADKEDTIPVDEKVRIYKGDYCFIYSFNYSRPCLF